MLIGEDTCTGLHLRDCVLLIVNRKDAFECASLGLDMGCSGCFCVFVGLVDWMLVHLGTSSLVF